ncbi:unnamed protein product [Clavelina lepadiformis]|uniref:RING-type domain-containing protein n=1 Tax=Clavelina lepadiformis TaxID=159417 RepID=A0ABP0EYC9_CLALP
MEEFSNNNISKPFLPKIHSFIGEYLEWFIQKLEPDEEIHKCLKIFQRGIISICQQSYQQPYISNGGNEADTIKQSLYIICKASLAETENLLCNQNFKNIPLLACLCILLNNENHEIRELLLEQPDWYETKIDIIKDACKQILNNHVSKERSNNLLKYLKYCSSNLKQGVNKYLYQSNSLKNMNESTDVTRFQRNYECVYIPPGDPVKESYRLSTFIKFPQETPVNPSNLAKVGFYYIGYKDRVICFSCGLFMDNWTQGDDVKLSRWHRNDCQMMRGEECGNVPIGGIFARFVNQGGQHATAPSGNLATENRQASGASKSNVSESHANLPVGSTARPAGEVLNSGPRRRKSAQTARPIRQPWSPSTNYQRVKLATIPSVHHEQLVRSLDLRKEADRMRSFSNSALETRTVYPSDLARSGFFYLGNLDRVQCFSCGGVLRNWNYGDNVHAEHRRHFPNCRMVQGTEGRNISIPPGDRLAPPDRPAMFREPPDPSETEQRELQSNFQCLYPVSPHMRNEDSRFETFDHRLPQSRVRATPRQIAKAGFFFLGERDRVKCWYCNGGLQNWDPDDEPWSEHAKWFPTCEFLLQRKGPDFVHRMVSLFPNLPRPVLRGPFDVLPPGSRGRGQRQPSPPPPIIDPQAEMQRVRSQVSEAMESSIVRNAVEMGFDSQVIRRLITRRFENRNEMYHSVNNLIEDLTHSPPSDHSDTDENCSDTERTPSVPTNVKRSDEIPFIEARIRELQAERKCKICLDRMADVASVSCGHLCSCTECTQALRNCPICRVKIENCTRTYML